MARHDDTRWTCGECRGSTRYTPKHDGDMPRDWMRLEDEWCIYVVCSFKCLGALVRSLEQRRTDDATGDGVKPNDGVQEASGA